MWITKEFLRLSFLEKFCQLKLQMLFDVCMHILWFSKRGDVYPRDLRSFSFSISPSSEYSGLISFRIDWFDLAAVQGTLKSLLQHQSSKASTSNKFEFWTKLKKSNARILVFLIFSLKLALSLSSFTLIKRLFSSSSLSAIRVVIIQVSEAVDVSPIYLDSGL